MLTHIVLVDDDFDPMLCLLIDVTFFFGSNPLVRSLKKIHKLDSLKQIHRHSQPITTVQANLGLLMISFLEANPLFTAYNHRSPPFTAYNHRSLKQTLDPKSSRAVDSRSLKQTHNPPLKTTTPDAGERDTTANNDEVDSS